MAHKQEIDVLHVIGTLSPGGAERNLYYLAPYLSKSRLSYGICCLTSRGELASEVESRGVPVFDLGYRRRHFPRTVFRLAGVPVIVVHEHGKTLWKKWYHRLFERLAIHHTDLRIAVSKDIMRLRLEHENTPPSKMRIVFNAVDPVAFELDDSARRSKRAELGLDDAFVIGTVGRLIEAKSYDLLLEVAGQVCNKRPEARFVLVGAGPRAGELERIRTELGLTEKVLMLGNRADIPELMAAMDLYIITSKREGLPVTLIEAMMAGKAIVSTGVGGIPDTLADGEDGIVVEPGDRDALVEAIVGLMESPETMLALGDRARAAAAEKYSPVKVLNQLEEIYEELLLTKGIAID
jgi:glycosyltransferase involved in cell wall biosynthesis